MEPNEQDLVGGMYLRTNPGPTLVRGSYVTLGFKARVALYTLKPLSQTTATLLEVPGKRGQRQ